MLEVEVSLRKAINELFHIVRMNKFDGKIMNTIFVLKGNPGGDEGLDNGIFRSSKKYDENFVNCITYKKFKSM